MRANWHDAVIAVKPTSDCDSVRRTMISSGRNRHGFLPCKKWQRIGKMCVVRPLRHGETSTSRYERPIKVASGTGEKRSRLCGLSVEPRAGGRRGTDQAALRGAGSSGTSARNGTGRGPDHQAAYQPQQFHLPGLQRAIRHQRATGAADHGRASRCARCVNREQTETSFKDFPSQDSISRTTRFMLPARTRNKTICLSGRTE